MRYQSSDLDQTHSRAGSPADTLNYWIDLKQQDERRTDEEAVATECPGSRGPPGGFVSDARNSQSVTTTGSTPSYHRSLRGYRKP